MFFAPAYASRGSAFNWKNESPNRNGFIIFLACSHLSIRTKLSARASEVDNLPGLPQDTGFAANTQGRVRPSNFVLFSIYFSDESICFHEQSKATIASAAIDTMMAYKVLKVTQDQMVR